MANIPTIVARPGLDGTLRTSASPEPDRGLAMMAGALGDVSQAASNVGQALAFQERRRGNEWADNAKPAMANALSEFQADPKTNTREDFASVLKEYSDSLLNDWIKQAPNKSAAAEISAWGKAHIHTQYSRALNLTFQNKQDAESQRFSDSLSYLTEDYMNKVGTPGTNPVGDYLAGFDERIAGINRSFELFPAMAEKKREEGYASLAAFLGDKNNAEAVKAIKEARGISEPFRERVLARLKADEPKMAWREQQALSDRTKQAIEMAKEQGVHTTVNPEDFIRMHGNKEDGLYDAQRAQEAIDAGAFGYDLAQSVLTELPNNQAKRFEESLAMFPEAIRYHAGEAATSIIVQRRKLLDDGKVVEYLAATDPETKQNAAELRAAYAGKNQNRQAAASKNYYDHILQKQHDMDVPQDLRRMFGVDEAKDLVADLTKNGPESIVNNFNQLVARFADPNHAEIALNDLITNGKLPGQYRAVVMNRHSMLGTQLAGAIKTQAFNSVKLTEQQRSDMRTALRDNPSMIAFHQTQEGRGVEFADSVEGISAAILDLAALRVMSGANDTNAVKESAKAVLDSEYITVQTDDQHGMLRLPRRISGSDAIRTEQDAPDIGRRLAIAKEKLDVTRLDPTMFPEIAAFPDDKEFGLQMARVNMLTNATWRNTSDENAVMLYYTTTTGAQPIRDASGKNLVIRLDKLPRFMVPTPERFVGAGGMGTARVPAGETPMVPKGAKAETIKRGSRIPAMGLPIVDLINAFTDTPDSTHWPISKEDDSFIESVE